MKIDWVNIFMVGFILIILALLILLTGFLIEVIPWIITNWILAAGIMLLTGLILIAIAYYMDFIREGGT